MPCPSQGQSSVPLSLSPFRMVAPPARLTLEYSFCFVGMKGFKCSFQWKRSPPQQCLGPCARGSAVNSPGVDRSPGARQPALHTRSAAPDSSSRPREPTTCQDSSGRVEMEWLMIFQGSNERCGSELIPNNPRDSAEGPWHTRGDGATSPGPGRADPSHCKGAAPQVLLQSLRLVSSRSFAAAAVRSG